MSESKSSSRRVRSSAGAILLAAGCLLPPGGYVVFAYVLPDYGALPEPDLELGLDRLGRASSVREAFAEEAALQTEQLRALFLQAGRRQRELLEAAPESKAPQSSEQAAPTSKAPDSKDAAPEF